MSRSLARLGVYDRVDQRRERASHAIINEMAWHVKPKMSNSGLTSIDLFAGAGGTALGFSLAGIDHVLCVEKDKDAAATLQANTTWPVIHGDVAEVDFTPYAGQVDIVEGGAPCQAFSHAGQRKGLADTRGTLFHELLRCVRECQPKVVMLENVRGMLTHDKGFTFKIICDAFTQSGYRVAHALLSAEQFDVPQKRERLIVIGVRHDLDIPILMPVAGQPMILGSTFDGLEHDEGVQWSEAKRQVMQLVPEGGNWRSLPEDVAERYMGGAWKSGGGRTGFARRLDRTKPAPTATCSPAQKSTEMGHPTLDRPLNVREYARLQTFPDTWRFAGSVASQYRQIGNAVPVNLAWHIGKAMRQMLGVDERDDTAYEIG